MKNPGFLSRIRSNSLLVLIAGVALVGIGLLSVLILNSTSWWQLTLTGLGVAALGAFLVANLSNVKEIGRKRSTQVRANLALVAVAVLAIVVTVNYIFSRHPIRFDLTANHLYTLSPQTLDILKGLKQDVTVTMLTSEKHSNAEIGRAESLLQEYSKYSSKFHFKTIDVDKNPSEAKRMDIHEYNTVVFESGDNRKDVLQRDYITYAFNGQQPTPKFAGESAFTSALLKMSDNKHLVFYFTTGHGERDRSNPEGQGLNTFQQMLQKENYEIKDLNLLTAGKIPADAAVVAIIGPGHAFQPAETALLEDYVKQGGKIVAMVDPTVNSGLNGLFKDFGVKLENDLVVDPTSYAYPDIRAVIPQYEGHPIVSKLAEQRLATIMPFGRSVDRTTSTFPGATQTVLLETTANGFGKRNLKDKVLKYHAGVDLKGPVPMAMACEWTVPNKPDTTARLVIFGNSTFITNQMVRAPGNIDLGLNSFSWAVGDNSKISIHPKEDESRVLNLSNVGASLINYLTILVMPLAVLILGGLIWWRRRSL